MNFITSCLNFLVLLSRNHIGFLSPSTNKKEDERILEDEQFADSGKTPESNSFQLGFYKRNSFSNTSWDNGPIILNHKAIKTP